MDKNAKRGGIVDCSEILSAAEQKLMTLKGHSLDVVDIKQPQSISYAKSLAKVVSKLSPFLGNMIEFSVVDVLNDMKEGNWIRQDPGFPDALFQSETVLPNPGIEIKAWFPFATEITARFKNSATVFKDNNINVALIAWLPEHVVWGKPQIIDVLVVSGKSVAEARDQHYHNPPNYIIFEPEDTSERSVNLQQTNTNGYKLQDDQCDLSDAVTFVDSWGKHGRKYSYAPEYQGLLRTLYGKFVYRLDTNYAKIDRIGHTGIEDFKSRVLNTSFNGKTIKQWSAILASKNDKFLEDALHVIF